MSCDTCDMPKSNSISVGMKETSQKAGNFTVYVKKVAAFIPGLRFHVQTSVKLQIDSKVRSPSWIFELSHAHVISVGHEGDHIKF